VVHGYSTIDALVGWHPKGQPFPPWMRHAITELLSSRCPVHPGNAERVLSIAAALGERRAAELAAVERSVGTTWREHERMVKLAFDFRELRAAERGVEARRARIAQLEREHVAAGIGITDSEEDEDEEEESESESESASGGDDDEASAEAEGGEEEEQQQQQQQQGGSNE
jgi:hypothetical protein